METTNVYCFRVTWKKRKRPKALSYLSGLYHSGYGLENGNVVGRSQEQEALGSPGLSNLTSVHLTFKLLLSSFCLLVLEEEAKSLPHAFLTQPRAQPQPLTTCFGTVLQLCLSHKTPRWLALVAQGGAGHVYNIYERKYDIKLVPNIECTFIRD